MTAWGRTRRPQGMPLHRRPGGGSASRTRPAVGAKSWFGPAPRRGSGRGFGARSRPSQRRRVAPRSAARGRRIRRHGNTGVHFLLGSALPPFPTAIQTLYPRYPPYPAAKCGKQHNGLAVGHADTDADTEAACSPPAYPAAAVLRRAARNCGRQRHRPEWSGVPEGRLPQAGVPVPAAFRASWSAPAASRAAPCSTPRTMIRRGVSPASALCWSAACRRSARSAKPTSTG